MPRYKNVNGVDIELTEEEVKEVEAKEKLAEEQKPAREMAKIREDRDMLLKETDWWGVSDRIMTDAQKKYRQDLRDIPQNNTIYADVTWPTKP